ncbi:MAG TPA: YggS family pyridoxal phosphate-dependent enzyme [Chitinophagaceae bacterium]|nr:YggS family pyridoxal phosphate-dependent enzyme [Chitinophagaceae bacterium]
MPVNKTAYHQIKAELDKIGVTLVAVSKTKPVEDILGLYELGHRDFGENYVQELVDKAARLHKDIRWHYIGHLQTNKVKLIAPFVQLIHGVDSLKLLEEIAKQAGKAGRVIDCLLQVHIANEETKFGLDEKELDELLDQYKREPVPGVRIKGLMGMASFTDNMNQVRAEFKKLKEIFDHHARLTTHDSRFATLSMGMSSDYKVAIEEGSTMARIGSLLFGERG